MRSNKGKGRLTGRKIRWRAEESSTEKLSPKREREMSKQPALERGLKNVIVQSELTESFAYVKRSTGRARRKQLLMMRGGFEDQGVET